MMKELTLKQLTEIIMKQADEKEFGCKPDEIDVFEKIALIHTEISESCEAYRHKKMDSFAENLGDTVQRVLHLCGIFDIDLQEEIVKKVKLNKSRDWKWDKMNTKNRPKKTPL